MARFGCAHGLPIHHSQRTSPADRRQENQLKIPTLSTTKALSGVASLTRFLTWPSILTGWIPAAVALDFLIGSVVRGELLLVFLKGWLLALALCFYWFWPAILTLPVVLPVAMLWKHPRRIVLLRPFQRPASSRALLDLASNVFAHYGHTYTLSDTNIRLPWFVRMPVLLGQLRTMLLSLPVVDSTQALQRFEFQLTRRVSRNIGWLLSPHHVFAVRSNADYWTASVDCLLNGADLVVLDLTDLKAGVVAEFDRCLQLGLGERMLLVCDQCKRVVIEDWLASRGAWAGRLQTYANAAETVPEIARTVSDRLGMLPASGVTHRGVAALTGLAVAAAMLLGVGNLQMGTWLPRFAPQLTVRYSPAAKHVHSVFLRAVEDGDVTTQQAAWSRLGADFPSAQLAYARTLLGAPISVDKRGLRSLACALETVSKRGSREDRERLEKLLTTQSLPEAYVAIVSALQTLKVDPRNALQAGLASDVTRLGAIQAIQKLTPQTAFADLLGALKWTGAAADTPVAAALDKLLEPAVIPTLIEALKEYSQEEYAIRALGHVGDSRGLVPMLRLASEKGYFPEGMIDALEKLARADNGHLIVPFAFSPNPGISDWTKATLVRLQSPSAFAPLLEQWRECKGEGPSMRITSCNYLDAETVAACALPEHVPLLIRALKSKKGCVLHAVRLALARLKDRSAIDALFDSIGNETYPVPRSCEYSGEKALDELLTQEDVPRVVQWLKSGPGYAASWLGRFGDCTAAIRLLKQTDQADARGDKSWNSNAEGVVSEIVKRLEGREREQCTRRLGELIATGDAAKEAALALAWSTNDEARRALVRALAAGSSDAEWGLRIDVGALESPFLVALLKDPSARVRYFALNQLQTYGRPDSVPAIEPFLRDPDRATALQAELTTRAMHAKVAVE
ncbi:MAG TPA: hypothetical protein VHP33_16695 [Polyangiaceae bacterium]|nr:hypothetical protein [Polyangiaceae bacterium]